jgi:integrase
MAFLQRITITRWVKGKGENRKVVAKGTPGARKVRQLSDKWYAVFSENGRKQRIPLSADKEVAQVMLADLLRSGERRKAGLPTNDKPVPIAELINAYLSDLQTAGRAERYVNDVRLHLNKATHECRFASIEAFNADKLDKWLQSLTCGYTQRNKYRAVMLTFANWLIRKKRLTQNPFTHIVRATGEVKRKRRAIDVDELLDLLTAAKERPLQGMSVRAGKALMLTPQRREYGERLGQARYLLYKTAVLTGLRRGELFALQPTHLHLDGDNPYLHLPGKYTKNGKDAILPLKHSHAQELQTWIKGKQPTDSVFIPVSYNASIDTLRKDMARAGIAYRDDTGRFFDFHSLRVCTSSLLHQAKVHPRIIQLFMRHADGNLTAHYDDASKHDLREALHALPNLEPEQARRQEQVKGYLAIPADYWRDMGGDEIQSLPSD